MRCCKCFSDRNPQARLRLGKKKDSEKPKTAHTTVQLRGKLTLASTSAVTRAFPSSARECSTPRSRATQSAQPLARVLLASARPLALVCYSRVLDRSLACYLRVLEAHGPRPSACRGKLIRPCTCENNKPSLALRDFAVLL